MLHFDAITDGSTEHDGPNKQYNPTIVFISVCKHTKMDLFTEGTTTLLRKVSIGSSFHFRSNRPGGPLVTRPKIQQVNELSAGREAGTELL